MYMFLPYPDFFRALSFPSPEARPHTRAREYASTVFVGTAITTVHVGIRYLRYIYLP